MDNEEEGYVPEYAKALEEMKESSASARGVAALPGTEDVLEDEVDPRAEAAQRVEDLAAAAKLAEVGFGNKLIFSPSILNEIKRFLLAG